MNINKQLITTYSLLLAQLNRNNLISKKDREYSIQIYYMNILYTTYFKF